MTNKLVLTLSSLARWKAFIRKYKGFTSTKDEEILFINNIHDYQKNWIKEGVGSPLAIVRSIDTWEAIKSFNVTVNELSNLDNLGDMRLYCDACLALEYSK